MTEERSVSCGFCGVQGKHWSSPWRQTEEEAQADWNEHVLTDHADLQWTVDHASELAVGTTTG